MKNAIEWFIIFLAIAVGYVHPPMSPMWSIITYVSMICYFIFSPLDWVFIASADAKPQLDQKS